MGSLSLHNSLLLFFVAIMGGLINSVAGGGSFLCFPALLVTGVPPIQANATNTMALWPGTLASVGAYRKEFKPDHKRMLLSLIATGVIGGLCGSLVLLKTPQATFLRLIPYLLGSATILFAFSPRITNFIRSRQSSQHRAVALIWGVLLQLCIGIYIGFFGAGAGILMLAMLAIMGLESIHTMNAYKTVLGTVSNGIALVAFIIGGVVLWKQAILMLVGASFGGYYGAYFAQKIDQRYIRATVIIVGLGMSAYFFWKQGF